MCRTQAEEADDISLLGSVGEKELRRFNRKGIFTVTQLACTFRPRKRSKRAKPSRNIHYPALQALSIREKKVHVYGSPELSRKPVRVFFDAEGTEGGRFNYLLGVLLIEGDDQTMHTFWADAVDQEVQLFNSFLDLLSHYEDYILFHYGGYEKSLLRRMRKVASRKDVVDRVLEKAVNVLSIIRAHIYFPTFSNGLKDIGRYLGCTWRDENASGIQSLVWRARWEQTKEHVWKDKLPGLQHGGLYRSEKGHGVRSGRQRGSTKPGRRGDRPALAPMIAWADKVEAPSSRREWGKATFCIEDFDHVNRCAHFDYQRERVFLRTSDAVRRACLKVCERRKAPKLPVNREVEFRSDICPRCEGNRMSLCSHMTHSKFAYDLKFMAGGIRRQVIRFTTNRYKCRDCRQTFLPKPYKRLDKYLHGLKSWAMYQLVVHRISLGHLEMMFDDCFGLRVSPNDMIMIRALMARRYREAVRAILARIVAGGLVHADETEVNLQNAKGYVWVLASMEDVVYFYRQNREACFLQEVLRDFKGVLVSDSAPGYESLTCEQQVCLIHLIRDMNSDLMSSPYDEEYKALAGEFGKLLRSIVGTIDKYGLKKQHMHKHKVDVARFFDDLAARIYHSELAESYQKRMNRNSDRLFKFLDHDGVPWNNNVAEHGIKAFAHYRELYDGQLSEDGLSDFLVLLSVQQTCKYRGVNFLKYLLSQEDDVETYCQRGRKKKDTVYLEHSPGGLLSVAMQTERRPGVKDYIAPRLCESDIGGSQPRSNEPK